MPQKVRTDDDMRALLLARSEKAPNGCRLWLGARKPAGYGNIWFRGGYSSTHRVAYKLWNGPIQEGFIVCHTCDTPACIEPTHLFEGTHHDNTADKVSKGRASAHARLSMAEVEKIIAARQGGALLRVVAAQFGVSECHVSVLARGLSRVQPPSK